MIPKSRIIALGSVINGKVHFVVTITKDLTIGDISFHSGDIVKEMSRICGGNGGGRSDFAQGCGSDISKLKEALEYVYVYVENKIKTMKEEV